MISASTLNSELINKIAQDFAQATSLAVVVVNIHGDEISELFNFTPFCQLMRQHPERRAGSLEKRPAVYLPLSCGVNRFFHPAGDCRPPGRFRAVRAGASEQ